MSEYRVTIHPHADVHPTVFLGHGSVVWSGAVILAGAALGADCVVGNGAFIGSHCLVGDGVRLSRGLSL